MQDKLLVDHVANAILKSLIEEDIADLVGEIGKWRIRSEATFSITNMAIAAINAVKSYKHSDTKCTALEPNQHKESENAG